MEPTTARLWGNIIMGVAVLVVLVNLCGMLGWTPKVAPPFGLNVFAFILILLGHALRRRGRASAP